MYIIQLECLKFVKLSNRYDDRKDCINICVGRVK